MAARMRDLASRLTKKVQGHSFARTRGHVTSYVVKSWSKLSQDGVIWLAKTSADMFKADEETSTLTCEIQALKEGYDQKLVQLFTNLDKLEDEKEKLKSEISRLEGKVSEKQDEVQMLRKVLAGEMGQMSALWMKYFMKNLNHSSPLPYYDLPESIGLIYWNPK